MNHINIRSLNKTFERLLEFSSIMKNEFDVIAISETWCNDDSINVNSIYQIPDYSLTHQIRKIGNKGGRLALNIQKTITFKTLKN